MKGKPDLKQLAAQFIKFGIVGLSNTAISLGIYYLFLWINPELYIVGNTAGFIVSVLNAYYWNRKYVFKPTPKGHGRALAKTFASYGFTFLVSTAIVWSMVELFQVPKAIPPLVSLVVTIPLNFLLNKLWTFK